MNYSMNKYSKHIFLTILILGVAKSSYCGMIDLNRGYVNSSKNYRNERMGTKDSENGDLIRDDKKFVIHYDIGPKSVSKMSPYYMERDCSWYLVQKINFSDKHIRYIYAGIKQIRGKSTLFVIIDDILKFEPLLYNYEKRNKNFINGFPANFWAEVNNETDVAELLLIAFSYNPKNSEGK